MHWSLCLPCMFGEMIKRRQTIEERERGAERSIDWRLALETLLQLVTQTYNETYKLPNIQVLPLLSTFTLPPFPPPRGLP